MSATLQLPFDPPSDPPSDPPGGLPGELLAVVVGGGFEAPLPELDSAALVLAFVRAEEAAIRAGEARLFAAAVTYAHQHPAESVLEVAEWGQSAVAIAGPGAPLVAEFAIPEFAAALGMSTPAGKAYLGHALEVHHRLPHTRALVQAGLLAVWRARRIAEHTTGLCEDGAAHLDQQVAPVANRVGPLTLDRLVLETLARFEPERAAEQAAAAAQTRRVRIGALGRPGVDAPGTALSGISYVDAVLDGVDAEDLETAVQLAAAHLAHHQQAAGQDPEPLDLRRAKALGIIARDYTTPISEQVTVPQEGPPGPSRRAPLHHPSARPKILHIHLAEAALHHCACAGTQLARLEEGDHKVVLAQVVRRWLRTGTDRGEQIIIKPVIDLAEHHHVSAYEIPHRIAEQTTLRDQHCVFPWCARPARTCDTDHIIAHARGGPTCSNNTAPLCRRHHRLKTHSGWTYTPLDPGTYTWTSPHNYTYLVDDTGTRDITPIERRERPHPPHPVTPHSQTSSG